MKLRNVIYCGDNLEWMRKMPDEFVDLIYADPPFFSNRHYEVIFHDGAEIRAFEDRWKGGIYHYIEWRKERCFEMRRILKLTGSLYLHCDWHASHYLKVMLDEIFGYDRFRNEIIWYYSVGGKSRRYWARKHDTIFFYTKTNKWTFNADEVKKYGHRKTGVKSFGGKIGRDEQGRLYQDKITKSGKVYRYYLDEGKVPEDVWEIQSLQSQSKERLGYPTQKPEALLERIILASSNPGDLVMDPFCGCGTTLAVAQRLGRDWLGIDVSPTACKLMKRRVEQVGARNVEIIGLPMTIEELKELKPFEFQNWIIGAMGGTLSERKVKDMGIDGYTFWERWPIQVKQQERVGRPVVDKFETALQRYGERMVKAAKERKNGTFRLKGIIVAFSFTKDAYEEAARAKSEGLEIKLLTVKEVVKEFNQ